jgi:hypothetical protein
LLDRNNLIDQCLTGPHRNLLTANGEQKNRRPTYDLYKQDTDCVEKAQRPDASLQQRQCFDDISAKQ